jgi:hypothetical protein
VHAKSPPVLYLLLVGIPLLGLLGVLYLGRGMTSSMSVGGRWKVDTQGSLATAAACGNGERSPEAWTIDVSQSGPRLTMLLGSGAKTPLMGNVVGSLVDARAKQSGGRVVALRAEIDRQAQPGAMAGTIHFAECPAGEEHRVTAVPFRAVRERPNTPKRSP